jgi:hypothetical protein
VVDGITSSPSEFGRVARLEMSRTRLNEVRPHSIKKLRASKKYIMPDRTDVTMTVPFMEAYVKLLIQTCHK